MLNNRLKPAFTMIEILVVTGMIMFLAAMILPRIAQYMGRTEDAKIKIKMGLLKESLQNYSMELSAYPSTKEGLKALVQNPRPNDDRVRKVADMWPFAKEEEILDLQGNDFIYHSPPEKFKNKYKQFEIIWESPENPDKVIDDGV
jgi:type II secretion system protein G